LQGADLPPRGLLGLQGGAAGDHQRPQRLDRAVLGRGGRLAGEDRTGGTVGVETVALALPATLGRAGAVDLHDLDAGTGQGGGDAAAVAAGALHADDGDLPVTGQPGDRRPVPGLGGGELVVGDVAAQGVDQRDVDGVGVRVDPADQPCVRGGVCHDGPALHPMGRHRPDRDRQDIHQALHRPGSY
jgi:hypothetical protein